MAAHLGHRKKKRRRRGLPGELRAKLPYGNSRPLPGGGKSWESAPPHQRRRDRHGYLRPWRLARGPSGDARVGEEEGGQRADHAWVHEASGVQIPPAEATDQHPRHCNAARSRRRQTRQWTPQLDAPMAGRATPPTMPPRTPARIEGCTGSPDKGDSPQLRSTILVPVLRYTHASSSKARAGSTAQHSCRRWSRAHLFSSLPELFSFSNCSLLIKPSSLVPTYFFSQGLP